VSEGSRIPLSFPWFWVLTVLISMPTHMFLYMNKLHRTKSGFTCGILNLRNIVLEICAVDGTG
jgi:hypothetical protein